MERSLNDGRAGGKRRPHYSDGLDLHRKHGHYIDDVMADRDRASSRTSRSSAHVAVNQVARSHWLDSDSSSTSNRPFDRYELWDREPKYYYGQERPRPRPKHRNDRRGAKERETDYRGNPAAVFSTHDGPDRRAWPEDESPPDNPEDESIYKMVKTFATDTSSAHGFPNIFKATTVIGRLLWTLIFITAFSIFIWQASVLVQRFFDYPVAVEIKIVTISELDFPAVTICNTNKIRRSALAKSRYKEALTVDTGQTLPYYGPCINGDFSCKSNELCLKPFLRCDGINHCRDYSDETGCTYGRCGNDEFRCANGSATGPCISSKFKCDRKHDCYDGDDETGCPCKSTEFACTKGGCISKGKRCNAADDCPDGSDENDCNSDGSCTGGFQCDTGSSTGGSCIPLAYVCDKDNDCPGGEDETVEVCAANTPAPTAGALCAEGEFDCSVGVCIPEAWVCDYTVECYDTQRDEDATLCGRENNVGMQRCGDGETLCGNGWQCTFNEERCTLEPVCTDGSDELNCTCTLQGLASSQIITCSGHTYADVTLGFNTVNDTKFFWMTCFNNFATNLMPINVWGWEMYVCTGGNIVCYNNVNNFPEPCEVNHECYISPTAQDYRGNEKNTTSEVPCMDWSMDVAVDAGFTVDIYPELRGATCRNPGGMRSGAWCFIQGATNSADWELCTIGQPSSTCHPDVYLPVRLVGGASTSEGRVEVQHSGVWGTVSDSDWTMTDAGVVCKQLGFTGATSATASFSPSSGDVFMSQVKCTGHESYLVDCYYHVVLPTEGVGHNMDVGVTCTVTRRKRQADDPTPAPACTENEYLCQSGECVPMWQTCNNYPDCLDGSDEYHDLKCEDSVLTCITTLKACRGSNQCIAPFNECDDFTDCKGGTDEQFCNDKAETCPEGYFKCKSGKCINDLRRCDTIRDCLHGDDEDEQCMYSSEDDGRLNPFVSDDWMDPFLDFITDEGEGDFIYEFKNKFYVHRPFSRVKSEDPADWRRFITFSEQPDYSDLGEVLKLTKEEISQFGHQQDDFILQCNYDGFDCRWKRDSFVQIQNDKYGNCYTFNKKISNSTLIRKSSQTGEQSGLTLTLFIEQDEYLSLHGQDVGVRVAISKSDVAPSPADEGINISPGTVTSIGLKYNEITRKPLPFGPCQIQDATVSEIVDGKIVSIKTDSYSRLHCRRICYLQKVQEICNCSDSMELDGERCKLLNTAQDLCRQMVQYLHVNYLLNCTCKTQCNDHLYTSTVSQSAWPSEAFRPHLLRNIHYINEKTQAIRSASDISRNLVRLKIYFEQLNYQETKEIEGYSGTSLFGDIGGTIGLYIGFSIVTFLEVFEFVFYLIRTRCCQWFQMRTWTEDWG